MVRPSYKAIETKIKINVLLEYKRRRCLWDIAHPDYHNQAVRNEELGHILKIWQKIDPTATIESIKMKILNMRTNYIRQRKKVENSMTGDGKEEFKPTLWYYKYLDFLTSNSAIKLKPKIVESGESYDDSDMEDMAGVDSAIKGMNEAMGLENEDSQIEDASAEAFGRSVGLQLSKLTDMQRWIAEKLISDILFQAKLAHLSSTSAVVNEDKILPIVKAEPGYEPSDINVLTPPEQMVCVKEEPESDLQGNSDLLDENVVIVEHFKVEENETENAVKFLQMY